MNLYIRFLLFFLLFSISNSFGAGLDTDCPECPIDGGASLLVGAGVAYGMKKIRDNKKSRKDLKDTI